MHIELTHKFSKAEAVTRVKQALEEARAKAGEQGTIHEERWEGDTFHFDVTGQGQRISGTVAVGDSSYDIQAQLPLMLRMFEGKIEAAIKAQAQTMLK